MISVLHSPIMGPLIVFACIRTAEGATRMADITPRDIRRVTAFFTMYREGNPCVHALSPSYPFKSIRSLMITNVRDAYNKALGFPQEEIDVQEVWTPLDSPHSSYPISLAFGIGLSWYIRRIDTMETDGNRPSPGPKEGDNYRWLGTFNIRTLTKWIRHITYKDTELPQLDGRGQFTSKRVVIHGSAVIFAGKRNFINHWHYWAFYNYMDKCRTERIVPSESGFKSFLAANCAGGVSPYQAEEVLGSEDAFAREEEGEELRKFTHTNLKRAWIEACIGCDRL